MQQPQQHHHHKPPKPSLTGSGPWIRRSLPPSSPHRKSWGAGGYSEDDDPFFDLDLSCCSAPASSAESSSEFGDSSCAGEVDFVILLRSCHVIALRGVSLTLPGADDVERMMKELGLRKEDLDDVIFDEQAAPPEIAGQIALAKVNTY
ncbi:hypothetical protein ZWY2020_009271 [Hordeum vulgare]|nr:hypothetical protein ZWY2020_009271 [Hordeum vulgare]